MGIIKRECAGGSRAGCPGNATWIGSAIIRGNHPASAFPRVLLQPRTAVEPLPLAMAFGQASHTPSNHPVHYNLVWHYASQEVGSLKSPSTASCITQ